MARKRGRPSVAEDARRSIRVTAALTADETDRLKRAADAAGARVSVVLRRAALASLDEHAAVPAPKTRAEDELVRAVSALCAQLAHVGRNLNQAVRAMNSGSVRTLLRRRDDEVAVSLRETKAVLDRILPVLAAALEARR